MGEPNKEIIKKDLVEIYEGYIKDSKNKEIKSKAQKLFLEFTYMSGDVDKNLMEAIRGLEHIGFDFGRANQRGAWNLTPEEAQEIFKNIK